MAPSPTVLAENNFLVPNATFIAELVAFLLILGIHPPAELTALIDRAVTQLGAFR